MKNKLSLFGVFFDIKTAVNGHKYFDIGYLNTYYLTSVYNHKNIRC